jgi:hypothetical protein
VFAGLLTGVCRHLAKLPVGALHLVFVILLRRVPHRRALRIILWFSQPQAEEAPVDADSQGCDVPLAPKIGEACSRTAPVGKSRLARWPLRGMRHARPDRRNLLPGDLLAPLLLLLTSLAAVSPGQ